MELDFSRSYSIVKSNMYALWLYNNDKKEIVFEITSTYPDLEKMHHSSNAFPLFDDWLRINYELSERNELSASECMEVLDLIDNIYPEIAYGFKK